MAFPAAGNNKQVVIKNTAREFAFKILNTDTSTIALADMAYQGVAPSGTHLLKILWSNDTTGTQHLELTRGTLGSSPIELLDLHGVGSFDFESMGLELTERSSENLNVEASGNGHHFTLICFLRKF